VLLAHEIAFVLGQMENKYAVPMLTAVLEDDTYDSVVRHEVNFMIMLPHSHIFSPKLTFLRGNYGIRIPA
jgi:HEAT repeat protein